MTSDVNGQQLISRRQRPILHRNEDCELPTILSPLMSRDSIQVNHVTTLKIVSLLIKTVCKTVETFAFLKNIIRICKSPREKSFCIQLFRERLSGKVHATILKGIVGGFEFSFFQRNLKELTHKALKKCLRVLKESNKSRFDSYSPQEHCIDHIPYYLWGLSRTHFFRQPFSK